MLQEALMNDVVQPGSLRTSGTGLSPTMVLAKIGKSGVPRAGRIGTSPITGKIGLMRRQSNGKTIGSRRRPSPDENSDLLEERQYHEAFALASEAQRTLKEAREAVRRTRAARGYYAPESSTGKGMSPTSSQLSKGKGKGRSKKGDGKAKRPFGPCFICGKPTHGYQQCPDRFAKGKSKGKGFGKSKGKGKGKPTFFQILLFSP